MESHRLKRLLLMGFWRLLNPFTRRLAGRVPWWVLIETQGRKTGQPRLTPLAAGPRDERGLWVIAVHRNASWVHNIAARPSVRVQHRGTWRTGTAHIRPWDAGIVRRFNLYARSGPVLTAIDPRLVYVEFDEAFEPPPDVPRARRSIFMVSSSSSC